MKIVLYSLLSLLGGSLGTWLLVRPPASPTSSHRAPQDELPLTGHVCDSAAFLQIAHEAESLRAQRRISAAEFARLMQEPATVVLDARAREHFEQLHVAGSLNLPYTHFGEESLSRLIPDTQTRILIYCRNNLVEAPRTFPVTPAFPDLPNAAEMLQRKAEFPYPDEFEVPEIPKQPEAGLNIPTFITLLSYGYGNVWELDEAVDPNQTPIPFAGEQPNWAAVPAAGLAR